jgi:hypothetical protein
MAPAVATYEPRDPSYTVLYKVVVDHLETFLASLDTDPPAKGLSVYVQRKFYDYLQCGILVHGFLCLGCDTYKHERLLAFSCKRRGFCPSCGGRQMPQTAAHLVERARVSRRQWVGVGAHLLALLDRTITGTHGKGSHDYSYYGRLVLREPNRQTWHRAVEGPSRVGDVYPAIQWSHQFECPLSCCLL